MVLNHQRKTGAGVWESFEVYLEASVNVARRKRLDARLGFAASYFTRMAYKEAADLIRAGQVEAGLAKVPSFARIKSTMGGRLAIADLEAHHTGTIQWARQLGVAEEKLAEMPAAVMNKFWHNNYISNLPEDTAFHRILAEEMRTVNKKEYSEIIEGLRRTYRKFEDVSPGEPDPDMWVVFEKWLEINGMQP